MRKKRLAVRWCMLCTAVCTELDRVDGDAEQVANINDGPVLPVHLVAHWRRTSDTTGLEEKVSCSPLKEQGMDTCEATKFSLYGSSNSLIACCKRNAKLEGTQDHGNLAADEFEESLEEKHPDAVDLTVAIMLIGSVTLVMSLFYLVNHHDADIKEYSWQVISATLAIFTSVLMFQGINGIMLHFMEKSLGAGGGLKHSLVPLLSNYGQLILWFVVLQCTIANICLEDESGKKEHRKLLEEHRHHHEKHPPNQGVHQKRFPKGKFDQKSPIPSIELQPSMQRKAAPEPGAVQWDSAPPVTKWDSAPPVLDRRTGSKESNSVAELVTAIVKNDPEASTGYGGRTRTAKQREHHHMHKILMMKCWAVLLAHTIGFAAIHAGGELQHLPMFAASPLCAFAAVIAQAGLLLVMFWASDTIRENFVEDENLKQGAKLWDEETEESENDIACISLSFLTVQALRFQFGGDLPSISGLESPSSVHSSQYVGGLTACSAFFAVLSVFFILFRRPNQTMVARIVHVFQSTCAMGFAWCLFYAAKEGITEAGHEYFGKKLNANGTGMRVMLACSLSCGALVLIFMLDTVEDLEATGDVSDKAIRSIINAIGILVGFSWEQAFDGGVEVLAQLLANRGEWYPVVAKFVMGLALAAGIIPAWRRHILKNSFKNEKVIAAHRQRREVKKQERQSGNSRLPTIANYAGGGYGGDYAAVPTGSPRPE